MDLFTFLTIVVIASIAAGIIQSWLKYRASKRTESQSEEIQARLNSLEKRIQVLEQIITDDKYRLEKELAQLSDKH